MVETARSPRDNARCKFFPTLYDIQKNFYRRMGCLSPNRKRPELFAASAYKAYLGLIAFVLWPLRNCMWRFVSWWYERNLLC